MTFILFFFLLVLLLVLWLIVWLILGLLGLILGRRWLILGLLWLLGLILGLRWLLLGLPWLILGLLGLILLLLCILLLLRPFRLVRHLMQLKSARLADFIRRNYELDDKEHLVRVTVLADITHRLAIPIALHCTKLALLYHMTTYGQS